MMYGWNGNGWGIFWMILSMVVFWGALVAVVVLLVRPGDRGSKTGGRGEDAAELLRRRFAAGEIPKEEYQERLRILDETRR